MRIRKGPRCVPAADADRRPAVLKGFAPGERNNVRREDDEMQCDDGGVLHVDVVVEAPAAVGGAAAAAVPAAAAVAPAVNVVAPVAASVAATSGCLDRGASSSERTMERLEFDQVQRQRLSADGYSRKRRARGPIAEGPGTVISISSIIQAGVKSSARPEPESAESGVVLKSPSTDGSPAMKPMDQPGFLLQSLKRVCSAAASTGLTAKEAVARIQEQRLPGLIDGDERLIVQVAKSFRSSSAFQEREERGRYFMQDLPGLDEWGAFLRTHEEPEPEPEPARNDDEAEFETIIEAAKQLRKLQEPVHVQPNSKVGIPPTSGSDRWTQALRGKPATPIVRNVEPPRPSPRDHSGPRCNRDDGKGWRCVRVAESGFSLCKYHRDQIRRAEIRRRKARTKSKRQRQLRLASRSVSPAIPSARPSNPTRREAAKTYTAPETEKIVEAKSLVSDNELPDHKIRRFVKAKSLKSLL